ncbi:MAG: CapA family protein, partial [Acidimicrobiales bacterium]
EDLVGQLKSNPTGLLTAIAPTLSGADFAMVNLETSLGTTGTKVPKAFNFQVPPQAIDALKAAGVDAVSMANNHGMDYGAVGLQDSLAIRASSGFPILGIGQNDTEAYAPLITEIKGQRLGVIAASDVFDAALVSSWTAAPDQPGIASAEADHLQRLVQEVQTTRPKVDTLVVYLHFGTEKQTCPNARQKEVVDALLAAGVDIVIGSHPHRLQGVGYQGKKLVAYSMSNFIFRGPSSESRKTGVLMVTATGQQIDGFEWKPATLQGNVPVLLSGSASQAGLTEMAQRRDCAGLTEAPT